MILRAGRISKVINSCPPDPKPLWHRAVVVVGTLAGIYLLLMVGVTLNQRNMMYFPSRYPQEVLEEYARAKQFWAWTNSAAEFIGWKRLSATQPASGQVLILHGNAAQALLWSDQADALQKLAPLDVYILEYPGYGPRPGKPSQKTIFKAATEGLAALNPERKTFLLGESLGTGVATYLAAQGKELGRPIAGMLLLAPYNNMSDVAQCHMRIFPTRWLVWDKYPSDKYLKHYAGPVGFLVAGQDRVIPKHFGLRLYESYQGPKRLWEFPEAGHDGLHCPDLDWWREALEFWNAP